MGGGGRERESAGEGERGTVPNQKQTYARVNSEQLRKSPEKTHLNLEWDLKEGKDDQVKVPSRRWSHTPWSPDPWGV